MFEYLICGEPSLQLVLSMTHRWPDDEMSLHSFQSLSVEWINKMMSDTQISLVNLQAYQIK